MYYDVTVKQLAIETIETLSKILSIANRSEKRIARKKNK